MKLRIISDFIDYYDHWFDYEGEHFFRKTRSGMSREEMFIFLKKCGYKVPFFGRLDVSNKYAFNGNVVVYIDEDAHQGEGKILTSSHNAWFEYKGHLCAKYIKSNKEKTGISYRHLQIGDHSYLIKMESSDWRSNYGDVKIKLLKGGKTKYNHLIKYPLYAIDFVPDLHGELYAVDFNIAPQMKGTGVEKILKAKEAATLIKDAYFYFKNLGKSCHDT